VVGGWLPFGRPLLLGRGRYVLRGEGAWLLQP
jgi:hypothetical protein